MIFFDIDTQYDFMNPQGALYVPRAEEIYRNLERLLDAAGRHRLLTISSRCAHEPGDAEFAMFPPHCLKGTWGAQRIFNLPRLALVEVASDAPAIDGAHLEPCTHYVVEKKVFDLFSNRWLEGLRVGGAFRDRECIVFGVATDYCVRAAALGLVEGGARVKLVADAVRGVAEESTAKALDEMRAAGVELTTTDEVLNTVNTAANDSSSNETAGGDE
jgi:nicotinamidase/pyrazinamidase